MIRLNPQASPHLRNPGKIPSLMMRVVLALLPATLFGIYLFGLPALNTVLLCLASALVFEAVCLQLAGQPVRSTLSDGSALLTGLLLALTLPPWSPWWIAVGGTGFAIIVGKQVYGGIGQNPFNPAMLARVALLLSFPLQMTQWSAPAPLLSPGTPDWQQALRITFSPPPITDASTGATLLGQVKTELSQGLPLSSFVDQLFQPGSQLIGFAAGSLGETSSLLLLLGGLYLVRQGIINWQLPFSFLVSITLLASLFHLIDAERYAGPLFHLSSGALMLAAFFILTDPVTSPTTITAQVLFGIGCALLVYVIRTWGGYPEGVAFAVLLMNALTPLIDRYLKPRRYGRDRRGQPLTIKPQRPNNPVEKVTGNGDR